MATAESSSSRVALASVLLTVLVFLIAVLPTSAGNCDGGATARLRRHRMLLRQEEYPGSDCVDASVHDRRLGAKPEEEMSRIGRGQCAKDNVVVQQSQSSPLPSGIPTYSVEVINTCLGDGCGGGVSDVHLSCGWFSSARLINPRIFRRLGFDDCLVNDGRPIPPGAVVAFQYAQTYPYTLGVSSVSCTTPKSP